jgi:endogenous inhibitor of DNA gyrase (YacG/DUF329 family)
MQAGEKWQGRPALEITRKMRVPQSTPRLYFSLLPSYFCLMPKCPTCARPVEWQDNPWRPFCSERCKLIDFSRWANEEYRVPGKEINPDEIVDHPAAGDSKSADDIEA